MYYQSENVGALGSAMKDLTRIACLFVVTLSIASCGGGGSGSGETGSEAAIEPIGFDTRIGIVPASN